MLFTGNFATSLQAETLIYLKLLLCASLSLPAPALGRYRMWWQPKQMMLTCPMKFTHTAEITLLLQPVTWIQYISCVDLASRQTWITWYLWTMQSGWTLVTTNLISLSNISLIRCQVTRYQLYHAFPSSDLGAKHFSLFYLRSFPPLSLLPLEGNLSSWSTSDR